MIRLIRTWQDSGSLKLYVSESKDKLNPRIVQLFYVSSLTSKALFWLNCWWWKKLLLLSLLGFGAQDCLGVSDFNANLFAPFLPHKHSRPNLMFFFFPRLFTSHALRFSLVLFSQMLRRLYQKQAKQRWNRIVIFNFKYAFIQFLYGSYLCWLLGRSIPYIPRCLVFYVLAQIFEYIVTCMPNLYRVELGRHFLHLPFEKGKMLDLKHQYNNCTTILHMKVGLTHWSSPSCEELLCSCCDCVVQESNPKRKSGAPIFKSFFKKLMWQFVTTKQKKK
jgi:hypothetical protein